MQEPNTDKQVVLQAKLIAFAVMISPLVFILVSTLLKLFVMEPGQGFVVASGAWGILPAIAGIIFSIVMAVVARQFRTTMTKNETSIEARMNITMLAMALAQVGGIGGLIYFLCTGDLLYGVIIMGISFSGCILLFPSTAWLLNQDKSPWEREE